MSPSAQGGTGAWEARRFKLQSNAHPSQVKAPPPNIRTQEYRAPSLRMKSKNTANLTDRKLAAIIQLVFAALQSPEANAKLHKTITSLSRSQIDELIIFTILWRMQLDGVIRQTY